MKKLMTTTVLALSLVTSFIAQAQPVYSNIVGMVKVVAEKGKFTYVASNFIPEGEVTVNSLFGSSFPSSTRVFFWDPLGGIDNKGGYIISSYGTRNGWTNGDILIERSKGFIISIPDTADLATYEVVLSGSVPTTSEEANASVIISAGLTLTGFPYPVAVKISEANFSPVSGDRVHVWTETGWASASYGTRSGWSDDLTIVPGASFFYQTAEVTGSTWEPTNPVTP